MTWNKRSSIVPNFGMVEREGVHERRAFDGEAAKGWGWLIRMGRLMDDPIDLQGGTEMRLKTAWPRLVSPQYLSKHKRQQHQKGIQHSPGRQSPQTTGLGGEEGGK